jgi:hypothetical protein
MHTQDELDDRYQCRPWYVRAYRWLRWMPLGYFAAAKAVSTYLAQVSWALMQGKDLVEENLVDEYWGGVDDEVRLRFHIYVGHSHGKMKWYYTMDEVEERIKAK